MYRPGVVDLSQDTDADKKKLYPYGFFIEDGQSKSPPTGFLNDDYVKLFVAMLQHGREMERTLDNIDCQNESWKAGKYFSDLMRGYECEVAVLDIEQDKLPWSWLRFCSAYNAPLDLNIRPMSNTPYMYDKIGIFPSLGASMLFNSPASDYNRTVCKQFVQLWLRTRKANDFGINETGGYFMICKCMPLAFIVHGGDTLHYSLLVTIDGLKWYHFDSITQGLNNGVAERGVESLRRMLLEARKNNALEDEPVPREFSVVHMNRFWDADHTPAIQPDGVSCLLYSVAVLDLFLTTNFDSFPNLHVNDTKCIHANIPAMREFCLAIYRVSWGYFNHVRRIT